MVMVVVAAMVAAMVVVAAMVAAMVVAGMMAAVVAMAAMVAAMVVAAVVTEKAEDSVVVEGMGQPKCFESYRKNSPDRRCRTCISLETQSLCETYTFVPSLPPFQSKRKCLG